MQDDLVFALTPAGEAELRGRATALSTAELDLLVRIDGTLSLREIRSAMPAAAREAFAQVLQRLKSGQLVQPVQLDPLDLQFRDALNAQALAQGQGQAADAGLASLRRSGYFVSIARPRRQGPPPAQDAPLTAMVVEDDEALAGFVRSYLAFEGWTVRVAGDRASVTAELRKLPVADLVVLDVMLPDIDGFLVLERLRQHPVLGDVPVIMLTGKANRESVIRGMRCGADGYITKPFEPDALMRVVHQVIGRVEPTPAPPVQPWNDRHSLQRRPSTVP